MLKQEAYGVHDQEDIIVLDKKDKPLSPEQVSDLEGPIDKNIPLKLPDFLEVKKQLEVCGLEVIGDREPCSGGIFGPLFKIKVREVKTGQEKYIIERTFTEVHDIERRFSLVEKTNFENRVDSEPRYEIVGHTDKKEDKLVIDYLYNEERALRVLQEIKGIPKFYGAVYNDLLGSTLQEFIEGYDLSIVLMQEKNINLERLAGILKKVEEVYVQAAEKGYIHGDPMGSTIMVDGQDQPYLTDWYLYSQGSIELDEEVKRKYLNGLNKIFEAQQKIMAISN